MNALKILYIEDDSIEQKVFLHFVRQRNLPYQITVASSYEEARSALVEQTFQIILSDYYLGDGTAFDLVPLGKNTPFIIITGAGDEEIAVSALRMGVYDYLVKDLHGNYIKLIPVTIENAIQRKNSEERTKLLTHAMMNISDSVFMTDQNFNIIFVNKTFSKVYGYSEEEILGHHCETFCVKHSKCACENGRSVEMTHRRKAGEIFPALVSYSTIQSNNMVVNVHISIDITERKQAEMLLLESEEKFRAISSSALDAIIIQDSHGKITYWNPSAQRIFGYTAEEALGKDMHKMLILPKQHSEFLKNHEFFSQTGRGKVIDATIEQLAVRKDGFTIPVELSISAFQIKEQWYSVGIVRDISERKLAQKALQESEKRLRIRNEVIEKDLQLARFILQALIPSQVPVLPNIKMVHHYSSLDKVGGDYFSYSKLDDNTLGIFIGDLAGHGISAALFLSLIRYATEQVGILYSKDTTRYISALNDHLLGNMPSSFITAIYGYFSYDSMNKSTYFTFCRAGHPYPILYRKQTNKINFVKTPGTLLAMFEDATFSSETIELEKGDRIFLYTDGVSEVTNRKNQMLGAHQFIDIIYHATEPSLSNTIETIMTKVHHFREGAPIEDDMVLIGFECL